MLQKFESADSISIEERMGVDWVNEYGDNWQGTIISSDSSGVTIVPVYALEPGMRCYGEGGSNRKPDNDRIKLKSCTQLFSELRGDSPTGECYALAAANHAMFVRFADFGKCGMAVLDGGLKISKQEHADIIDNLWREEKQKFLLMQMGVPTSEQVHAELERDAHTVTYEDMLGDISEPLSNAFHKATSEIVMLEADRSSTYGATSGDANDAYATVSDENIPQKDTVPEMKSAMSLVGAIAVPEHVGAKARMDAKLKENERRWMAEQELGDFSGTIAKDDIQFDGK